MFGAAAMTETTSETTDNAAEPEPQDPISPPSADAEGQDADNAPEPSAEAVSPAVVSIHLNAAEVALLRGTQSAIQQLATRHARELAEAQETFYGALRADHDDLAEYLRPERVAVRQTADGITLEVRCG